MVILNTFQCLLSLSHHKGNFCYDDVILSHHNANCCFNDVIMEFNIHLTLHCPYALELHKHSYTNVHRKHSLHKYSKYMHTTK